MAASRIHQPWGEEVEVGVGVWGGGWWVVLGEGGTAAMASRLDPDGPRQKGLDHFISKQWFHQGFGCCRHVQMNLVKSRSEHFDNQVQLSEKDFEGKNDDWRRIL